MVFFPVVRKQKSEAKQRSKQVTGNGKEHWKRSFPVRICCVQYRMRRISSFDDFAKQCEFFVDVAADYESDFVLFPEMISTQLLSTVNEKSPIKAVKRIATFTNQYIKVFRAMAMKFKINIISGSHFVSEGGRIYNVSFLFRRDGTMAKQHKVHATPSERKLWGISEGHRIGVFQTDCGKIAIQICYDIEFPEMSRILASKGAKIIFVPFSTDDRQGYLRVRYCAQARAVENQIYVATAGVIGNLPHVKNMDDIRYARSAIFTPSDFSFPRDGIAAECEPNIETVVVADVDLDVLDNNRRKGTVMQRRDIRKDLYEVKLLDKNNNLS